MGAFNRFIVAAVVLTSSLIGATSTNAKVVSSGSCQAIFSLTATDMSGVAKAGSFTEIYGVSKQTDWDRWFELDHAIVSAGVANFCALTNAQIDANAKMFGGSFDPRFKAGDELAITFMPDSSTVMQTYTHILTAEQATAANNKSLVTLPNLIVSPTSQISVVVKDSAGNPQQNSYWEIWKEIFRIEDGVKQSDYSFLTYASTRTNGAVEVAGLLDGNYQLHGLPGDNPSALSIRTKANFSITGGGNAVFSGPNVANGTLTLQNGNVKFQIVDGSDTPFTTSLLDQISPYIDDEDLPWDSITRRNDGTFVANLPNKNAHVMSVYTPAESGYVSTTFEIVVTDSGATFKKNGTTINPVNGLVSLQMNSPNVGFRVLGADGGPVPGAIVQIVRITTSCDTEEELLEDLSKCDPDLKYADITDLGTGIANIADGSYWLRMEAWNGSFGSMPSLSRFTVSNGTVTSVSGSVQLVAPTNTQAISGLQTLVVSTKLANLQAKVTTQAGIAINGGYADSAPTCPDYVCNHSVSELSWSEIDSTGRIALDLKAPLTGTRQYEVQVSPSERLRGEVSNVLFTAVVNASGEVVSISAPTHLSQMISSPVKQVDGFWSIKLPSNNFSGKVFLADGTTIAPESNINVRKWNATYQMYDWGGFPDIQVGDDGSFGSLVTPGRYEIQVNPPFDLGKVTSKTYEIAVSPSGAACLIANATVTSGSYTCNTPVAAGNFNLLLGNPNVTGYVLTGSNAVNDRISSSIAEQTYAVISRFDDRYDYWEQLSNSPISSDASYSFNVDKIGTYKIDVDPGYLENYGSSSHYLVVGKSGANLTFCNIPEPGLDTMGKATCGGNTVSTTSMNTNIVLQPTNLKFSVSVPPAFSGWVSASVDKLYEVAGIERQIYMGQVQLSRPENSSTYVGFSALGDNNGIPAKYRITINGYQDEETSLPLAKKSLEVWVVNVDSDSEKEICPEAFSQVGQDNVCAKTLLSKSNPLGVTLDNGNMKGVVKSPDVAAKVAYPSIQVQRWDKAYWWDNKWQYSWIWTDLYAEGNADGAFALDIADPGYYKVTAKQQWGGKLPFADQEALIQVNGFGNWCVHNVEIPTYKAAEVPVTSCSVNQFGRDNVADTVNGLTLSLLAPKISGYLEYVSDKPAEDSHIQIRKWNGNYYEYAGWTNVNSEGKFFLNPSDGDYSLKFYPNWENEITDVSFVEELCLGSGSGNRPINGQTCSATHNNLNLQFQGPNLSGKVCEAGTSGAACEGVDWSWIEVREKGDSISNDPGYWSWIDQGAWTIHEGKFAMQLTSGTAGNPEFYSLRAHPDDPSEQGAAKTVVVSIEDTSIVGTKKCQSGASTDELADVECDELEISLLSPNVEAIYTYDDTDSKPVADRQLMKHSWVSIYTKDYDSYVSGSFTNWEGKLSAYLPVGEYFIDAYSNSNYASRPSLRLTIKVEAPAGNSTVERISWKYRNDLSYNPVGTPIVADFDKIPPNVQINLSSKFASSHIVLIKDIDTNVVTREQPRRFVSNQLVTDGPQLAKGSLTVGKTYSFKVVPNYGETLVDLPNVANDDCLTTATISAKSIDIPINLVSLTGCEPSVVSP